MRMKVNRMRIGGLSGLLLLTFAVMGCSGSAKTAGTGVVADSATTNNSAGAGTGTTTGSATLSWQASSQNTDGSQITALVGYRVYYGTSADALTETVYVNGESVTTYVVDGLSSGTYYFAVAALAADGQESALSDTSSKTI